MEEYIMEYMDGDMEGYTERDMEKYIEEKYIRDIRKNI